NIRTMNLSGLGMSGPLDVNIGENQSSPQIVHFPAGITFDDIEVTDILLGSGNDRMDIAATSPGTFGAGNAVVTVLHGGGNTPVTTSGSMNFAANAITRTDGRSWSTLGFVVGQYARLTAPGVASGPYEIQSITGTQIVLRGASLGSVSGVAATLSV